MKEYLIKEFAKVFGEGGDIHVYFAPGRVNLIGEHTDYNGGHVFPCALTIGTYGVFRKRADRKLRFYSLNFPQTGLRESSLEDLVPSDRAGWTNYPKGVVWAFEQRGMKLDCGFDFMLYGTIPNGSGLSSSASVEVLTGYALTKEYGFSVTNQDLALIGQFSERNYNGVNCGIMDQFSIAMGKADHAIFLDTATLKYDYAPVKMDGVKIVIMNTNKKRGLADSKYNERRSECEQAVEELKAVKPELTALGELTCEEFEELKGHLSSETIVKRARHAVYENQRTIRAVKALNDGDLVQFGQLMNDSHTSLRDDYAVTGVELDTLAEEAQKQPGVLGARMTGAGFGGCGVALVKEDAVDAMVKAVGDAYLAKVGYKADFYVVSIGDGPVEI